jgi:hypothetical protein
MSQPILLSDILARGAATQWFEAVALVAEVAERVGQNLAGQSVPELHQVQLYDDGRVALSGAQRTDEPIRRLGQLLQATLVQSDPPVQLRLIVSQATSPTPAFGSVREFSDALAYFERPDRPAVLRGLYARAEGAPAAPLQSMPTLDAMAPLAHTTPEKPTEPRVVKSRRRRSSLTPAIAAGLLLVVAPAAYWQYGKSTAAPDVPALATKASDIMGTAVVSAISSVSDRVGLGRLAPAEGSGAVSAVAPVQAVPPAARAAVRTARSVPPRFQLYELGSTVPASAGTAVETTLPIADSPPALTLTELAPDTHVYSAADPDVTAPVGVRPQLPAALPADVDTARLNQIELLVMPDGTVGSVRMLGRPRNVLEGMLLSAAKAWRFAPASKDGRPVAYRKVVWVVLS